MAAWSMLHGRMAELATGEGKTLAASLTAATAALAGRMVHVVTVNDYLAERDHARLSPLYRALGTDLRPGRCTARRRRTPCRLRLRHRLRQQQGTGVRLPARPDAPARAPDSAARPVARLDGRHAHEDALVLRGLDFAIVDEADSVLIDEARTPLIISETADRWPSRIGSASRRSIWSPP